MEDWAGHIQGFIVQPFWQERPWHRQRRSQMREDGFSCSQAGLEPARFRREIAKI